MVEIIPSPKAMRLITSRIPNARARAMTAHWRLILHFVNLPNRDRTPALPSDKAVREIARRAGIKTITTATPSPGSGNRVAAKLRAMVRAQKIANPCCLVGEDNVFMGLSLWQEACR